MSRSSPPPPANAFTNSVVSDQHVVPRPPSDDLDVRQDVVALARLAVVGDPVEGDAHPGRPPGVRDEVELERDVAHERLGAAAQDVRARPAVERVEPVAPEELVGAGPAAEEVLGLGALEDVVALAAVHPGGDPDGGRGEIVAVEEPDDQALDAPALALDEVRPSASGSRGRPRSSRPDPRSGRPLGAELTVTRFGLAGARFEGEDVAADPDRGRTRGRRARGDRESDRRKAERAHLHAM